MQIHLILAARNRECINPLMHTGPGAKLDSARFSWKRDISVSTEFQTTLVRVHDSLFRTFRSSERFPPRANRETLLSERQINVDTRVYTHTTYPTCSRSMRRASLMRGINSKIYDHPRPSIASPTDLQRVIVLTRWIFHARITHRRRDANLI